MLKLVIFDWGRTLYDNDHGRLFDDAVSVLDYVTVRYQAAVVSIANAEDMQKRRLFIRENNLEKYFTQMLFGDNKDTMYEQVLGDLQLSPKLVAVVDDRVVRGIRWGNTRGATTIWFRQGKFSDELPDAVTGQPNFIITKLSQLKDIL